MEVEMEQQTHDVESKTGTRDITYNLISVMYHALQGAETYVMYVKDAEQAGESDMAQFFRQAITENQNRADEAKRLLSQRLGNGKAS
jgi:rubrerythrin